MDKKVFLLRKSKYPKNQVKKLTENDLEELVAKDGYEDNDDIIKVDANDYSTPESAIYGEFGAFIEPKFYHVLSFGF